MNSYFFNGPLIYTAAVSAVSAEAVAETTPAITKTINVNNKNGKVAWKDIKCVSGKLCRVNAL